MTAAAPTTGLSFMRRRSSRLIAGAAGIAGLSLVGAAPAFAASDADCTDGNTLYSGGGDTAADIQTLLDADTAVICLNGDFTLTTTLTADHSFTLYGFPYAGLDGDGSVRILEVTGTNKVTVQNLQLLSGYASSSNGGAIDAYEVEAIDSYFWGNYADWDGGAINADVVTVTGTWFENNYADGIGGAIYAGDVTAELSFFAGNSAGITGGAISGSVISVTDSQFYDNGNAGGDTTDAGGAINGYSTITVSGSTFAGNFAQYAGGAIYGWEDVFVENSTFVENVSFSGGGAILSQYGGEVIFSTFYDNLIEDGGGGAVGNGSEDELLLLRGNIFATHDTAYFQVGGSGLVDGGGNLFSTSQATETEFTATEASTRFGLSPETLFGTATLDDNGGPTPTVALYAGSPAVNAVPAGEPSVATDQRGVARDAVSDSGAYEWTGGISPDTPALANTGSDSAGWIAAAAGVLLAAGTAVVGLSRRRRTS